MGGWWDQRHIYVSGGAMEVVENIEINPKILLKRNIYNHSSFEMYSSLMPA